jgi:F0F1-type ATP synthase delta subunit
MITRRQVATYVADNIDHDRARAIQAAAAWLEVHKKTRQAKYLANDVAQILATRGYLWAQVTTANPIDESSLESFTEYLHSCLEADFIELCEAEDNSIIGGFYLQTPNGEVDETIKTKLLNITALGGRSV